MPDRPDHTPEIVTTDDQLASLCERLSAEPHFAYDTEFVAEESYARQICLIQVATRSWCALIDPLEGLDAEPFWRIVAGDAIEKIAHSGSEDAAVCRQAIGVGPAHVFDTQVVAGFVGFGHPISLARLVHAAADGKLNKSQTLTDWRKRPLSKAQINYAVEDVIHLHNIYDTLHNLLEKTGRTAWAAEECRRYCETPAAESLGKSRLRKLRGAGSLKRRELAIVDALLQERDALAAEYDRPVRAVLRDHLLVEIARHGLSDVEKLRSLRGINLRGTALARLGEVVTRAKQLPLDQCPEVPEPVVETPEQEILADVLTAVLRDYSHTSGIAMSLLANKAELRAFVRARTNSSRGESASTVFDTGWRREAARVLLDGVVSGRTSLRFGGSNHGAPTLRLE